MSQVVSYYIPPHSMRISGCVTGSIICSSSFHDSLYYSAYSVALTVNSVNIKTLRNEKECNMILPVTHLKVCNRTPVVFLQCIHASSQLQCVMILV